MTEEQLKAHRRLSSCLPVRSHVWLEPEKPKLTPAERVKKWRMENQERILAWRREWRAKRREHLREYFRSYREKNRERVRENERRYYTRKKQREAAGSGGA